MLIILQDKCALHRSKLTYQVFSQTVEGIDFCDVKSVVYRVVPNIRLSKPLQSFDSVIFVEVQNGTKVRFSNLDL